MIRHLTNIHPKAVPAEEMAASKYCITSIENCTFRNALDSVVLIVSGQLNIKINGMGYRFSQGNMAYVPAGSSGEIYKASSSVVLYNCSFTQDYLTSNLMPLEQASAFKQHIFEQVTVLNLSVRNYTRIETLYRLLCEERASLNEPIGNEINKLYFNVIICEMASVLMQVTESWLQGSKKQQTLLDKFKILVREHVRQQHGVQFYAAALCVSPGHLTKIIKNSSSKTVKQMIEEALIREAKRLLHLPHLSILHITEELQFSTISGFCKFFKKHTRMTPTAFRNSQTLLSIANAAQ